MGDYIPEEVRKILGGRDFEKILIKVRYKNWRNEIGERKIIPLEIYFGRSEFHQDEQWLLKVWDLDRKDYRVYALRDIEEWIYVP